MGGSVSWGGRGGKKTDKKLHEKAKLDFFKRINEVTGQLKWKISLMSSEK